jgi:hypothetical protein
MLNVIMLRAATHGSVTPNLAQKASSCTLGLKVIDILAFLIISSTTALNVL